MAAEVDLLVLAELNPDVLVSSGDADMRFGQVEQLIDRASITLGSSGAITACAAAAQGLRVAVCAVIGDDPIGEWTAEQLRGHGVDIAGVIRRPGRQTGMSVVLTRSDGDRAILTYSGTAPVRPACARELVLPPARLASRTGRPARCRAAGGRDHVLGYRLGAGRRVGERRPGPAARALPAAERGRVRTPGRGTRRRGARRRRARRRRTRRRRTRRDRTRRDRRARAARRGARPWRRREPGDGESQPTALRAAALRRLGPDVAVKLGASGALAVTRGGVTRVRGRAVAPVDTTGAGDCFNAGFIAGVLDGSTTADSLRRAVACGSIAVTGWGGTGRLATRAEALQAAAQLPSEQLPSG